MPGPTPRVVVVLPAYNAARTLERTVREIPPGSVDALLLVDDASSDETVAIAETLGIPTVVHPVNRGYGANQKTCYRVALEMGADIVVMLHPDYQYDPRLIPEMVARLQAGDCDAVIASRMLDGGARRGGMPWWKRFGNRLLTSAQNLLLGTHLSEFHTGYRAFSRGALELAGFHRFADGFVFDAQMLVSLIHHGRRIAEIPCPARYLPEASSIDLKGSVRYGLGCLAVSARHRLNRLGLMPSGWLGASDPAWRERGLAVGILEVLVLMFLIARFAGGVDWETPRRTYDSWSYNGAPGWNLVSLGGDAPRTWPIPLLYSFLGNDRNRVLVQMLLGSIAWIGLATIASRFVRQPLLSFLTASGILLLGLAREVSSWDGFIMSESLAITLMVGTTGLLLRYVRTPSVRAGIAVGTAGGLLALARPAVAPAVLLLGFLGATYAYRRRELIALTIVVPLLLGAGWLVTVLPSQDEAYERFERRFHAFESGGYASDAFASVLFGRLAGNPSTARWLTDNGAPQFAPEMVPRRGLEDPLGWSQFRRAYGPDPAWQQWFQARGRLRLTGELLVEEPVTHTLMFLDDLPFILRSPWRQPTPPFDRYGLGVPTPLGAWFPFYRSWGPFPIDLVLLALAFAAAAFAGRDRPRWLRSPLVRVGLGLVASSCLVVATSWVLVGIELMRHAVPGPMGIRLGFLLALVGTLDLRLAPDDEEAP